MRPDPRQPDAARNHANGREKEPGTVSGTKRRRCLVAFASAPGRHNQNTVISASNAALIRAISTSAASSSRLICRISFILQHAASSADRKSDVEGKSVSVRVDLGGRRIIKKKQK